MNTTNDATIWIIEDDRLFRRSVEKLLRGVQDIREVTGYASCEDALHVLEQGHMPDVILMDIGLPGMSGIEGIERIKSAAPQVYIIMLTVHEDNDKIFNALCAGASGYLLKPSSATQIIQAISVARQGGASMNPHIASKVLHMFTSIAAPRTDYGLTTREREILQYMAEDLNKPAIANRLHLSYHTIDMHVRNIYTKLHVHTAAGAIAKALKERII